MARRKIENNARNNLKANGSMAGMNDETEGEKPIPAFLRQLYSLAHDESNAPTVQWNTAGREMLSDITALFCFSFLQFLLC